MSFKFILSKEIENTPEELSTSTGSILTTCDDNTLLFANQHSIDVYAKQDYWKIVYSIPVIDRPQWLALNSNKTMVCAIWNDRMRLYHISSQIGKLTELQNSFKLDHEESIVQALWHPTDPNLLYIFRKRQIAFISINKQSNTPSRIIKQANKEIVGACFRKQCLFLLVLLDSGTCLYLNSDLTIVGRFRPFHKVLKPNDKLQTIYSIQPGLVLSCIPGHVVVYDYSTSQSVKFRLCQFPITSNPHRMCVYQLKTGVIAISDSNSNEVALVKIFHDNKNLKVEEIMLKENAPILPISESNGVWHLSGMDNVLFLLSSEGRVFPFTMDESEEYVEQDVPTKNMNRTVISSLSLPENIEKAQHKLQVVMDENKKQMKDIVAAVSTITGQNSLLGLCKEYIYNDETRVKPILSNNLQSASNKVFKKLSDLEQRLLVIDKLLDRNQSSKVMAILSAQMESMRLNKKRGAPRKMCEPIIETTPIVNQLDLIRDYTMISMMPVIPHRQTIVLGSSDDDWEILNLKSIKELNQKDISDLLKSPCKSTQTKVDSQDCKPLDKISFTSYFGSNTKDNTLLIFNEETTSIIAKESNADQYNEPSLVFKENSFSKSSHLNQQSESLPASESGQSATSEMFSFSPIVSGKSALPILFPQSTAHTSISQFAAPILFPQSTDHTSIPQSTDHTSQSTAHTSIPQSIAPILFPQSADHTSTSQSTDHTSIPQSDAPFSLFKNASSKSTFNFGVSTPVVSTSQPNDLFKFPMFQNTVESEKFSSSVTSVPIFPIASTSSHVSEPSKFSFFIKTPEPSVVVPNVVSTISSNLLDISFTDYVGNAGESNISSDNPNEINTEQVQTTKQSLFSNSITSESPKSLFPTTGVSLNQSISGFSFLTTSSEKNNQQSTSSDTTAEKMSVCSSQIITSTEKDNIPVSVTNAFSFNQTPQLFNTITSQLSADVLTSTTSMFSFTTPSLKSTDQHDENTKIETTLSLFGTSGPLFSSNILQSKASSPSFVSSKESESSQNTQAGSVLSTSVFSMASLLPSISSTQKTTNEMPPLFNLTQSTTQSSSLLNFSFSKPSEAKSTLYETKTTLSETKSTLSETKSTLSETKSTLSETKSTLSETKSFFGECAVSSSATTASGVFGRVNIIQTSLNSDKTSTFSPFNTSNNLFGNAVSTSNSLFDNTSTNSTNLFGKINIFQNTTANTSVPLFGNASGKDTSITTLSTPLFSNVSATRTTPLFGNLPTSSTTSLTLQFGNVSTLSTSSIFKPLFGNASTASSDLPTSLFGNASTANPASSTSLFGNTLTANSALSTSLFGNAPSSSTTGPTFAPLFGKVSTPTASTFKPLFDNASTSSTNLSTNTLLFGNVSTFNTTLSTFTPLFGNVSTSSTSLSTSNSLFGNAPIFNTTVSPSISLFGNASISNTPLSTPAPLFGNVVTTTFSPLFGTASSSSFFNTAQSNSFFSNTANETLVPTTDVAFQKCNLFNTSANFFGSKQPEGNNPFNMSTSFNKALTTNVTTQQTLFGSGNLFGSQSSNSSVSSQLFAPPLFGASTFGSNTSGTGSIFSSSNTSSGSLFANSTQPIQTSTPFKLFGNTPATPTAITPLFGSKFGQPTTGGLFDSQSGNTLFGTPLNTSSIFKQESANPETQAAREQARSKYSGKSFMNFR